MNLIALKLSFVFYFCLDNIIKPIIPMLFMTLLQKVNINITKRNKSFLWNFKRFSYDTLQWRFYFELHPGRDPLRIPRVNV